MPLNLDDFEKWMRDNPKDARPIPDTAWSRKPATITVDDMIPPIYKEILSRFGPVEILESTLLGYQNIPSETQMIWNLSKPEYDVDFSHLVAFCNLGLDSMHLCFDGTVVRFFEPLEPSSPDRIVTHSFEEFLDRFIEARGQYFWISDWYPELKKDGQ